MSTIYYLQDEDFSKNGNNLSINMGGLTLVMYHSSRCTYCNNFMPHFKNLCNQYKGVNFGLCNLDGSNIPSISKNSSTPITAVPKIILYNNGVPYVEYNGKRNTQSVIHFLNEIISNMKQSFVGNGPRRSRQQMPSEESHNHPNTMRGNTEYKVNPNTGVKEYDTCYGRPYNMENEGEFLKYQEDYKKKLSRR